MVGWDYWAGGGWGDQVESANIGKAAPKPEFLDEAEQGDGRLKEEGEAQSGGSDQVSCRPPPVVLVRTGCVFRLGPASTKTKSRG